MERSGTLTLRDYVKVVRRWRALIAAVAVVFAAVAFGLAARQDTVYQASTQLAVRDVSQAYALLGQSSQAELPPAQLAAQTAETLAREEVARRAIRRLRLRGATPRGIQDDLGAHVDPRTNLVVLEARAPTARRAARLADAVAAEGVALATADQERQIRRAIRSVRAEVRTGRRALRAQRPGADVQLALATQRLSQLQTLGDVNRPVQVVRAAQEPDGPVAPRPLRDTVLGGVLGLVIGLLLAFARAALDRRLRTTAEVQEELDLPVVGRIGSKLLGTAALPSANGRPDDPDLEAVRMLRTNIDFLSVDDPPRTVVVTSALPDEGKSTVAVALAATAATRPGARVLLVECDLRRPVLAERLGLRATPGLSDYLAGRASPAEVVQTVALPGAGGDGPRLVCVTAGTPVPRPAELLQTERMRDLVAKLRDVYDLVVLDATPLLAVVDALELVTSADGVLFCVRAGRTTREQARAAAAALAKLPARPTGVVVTGIRAGDDEAYGYYSYAYGDPGRAPTAA